MSQARPKVKEDLLKLSNEEWISIINNYIRSEENRKIAIMYYINGIPQEDIGAELNLARSTIRDRLYYKILPVIEKNAKRQS